MNTREEDQSIDQMIGALASLRQQAAENGDLLLAHLIELARTEAEDLKRETPPIPRTRRSAELYVIGATGVPTPRQR